MLIGLSLLLCSTATASEGRQWDVFETSFKSAKNYTNAFAEVEVNVVFRHDDTQWIVPAFWAGGTKWTVRFAPPVQGEFKYRVESTDKADAGLNGKEQALRVTG